MIVVDDLTVSFGNVRPIAHLDLVVDAAIHGVIGPNGAGKTTLLNACNGFTAVTGSITMFGDDISAMRPHRRAQWGLRRSFQTVQLADMSLRDNVAVGSDHGGRCNRGGRSVEDSCRIVGLAEIDRSAASVTLFEARLAEIARAIVGSPRVVMLDEPAATISSDERRRLVTLLQELPELASVRLVLIDHDIELIASVCQTVTALNFGSHIATGPTADVLADPVVVATYLGEEN